MQKKIALRLVDYFLCNQKSLVSDDADIAHVKAKFFLSHSQRELSSVLVTDFSIRNIYCRVEGTLVQLKCTLPYEKVKIKLVMTHDISVLYVLYKNTKKYILLHYKC